MRGFLLPEVGSDVPFSPGATTRRYQVAHTTRQADSPASTRSMQLGTCDDAINPAAPPSDDLRGPPLAGSWRPARRWNHRWSSALWSTVSASRIRSISVLTHTFERLSLVESVIPTSAVAAAQPASKAQTPGQKPHD